MIGLSTKINLSGGASRGCVPTETDLDSQVLRFLSGLLRTRRRGLAPGGAASRRTGRPSPSFLDKLIFEGIAAGQFGFEGIATV